MTDWKWLQPETAEAVHDEQLTEHGGGAGVRDAGALLSALARPRNLAGYGDPDVADLAAAYAFGIAKNHSFIDGNKRTAWIVARLFLHQNAINFKFEDADAVVAMLSLAAGDMTENELAHWIRERISTP